MDDLLSDFLTETAESLDVVDVELVQFEKDPNDGAILDNIFRLVHTIKGTCGFLGLPRLEALAHAAETLMGRFRDGAEVTPQSVTTILASIDRIKEILSELEATEAEPEGSDQDLIDQLNAMAGHGSPQAEQLAACEEAGAQQLDRELRPGEVSLEELEAAFRNAPGPESDESPAACEPAPPAIEPAAAMPAPAKDAEAANKEKKDAPAKKQSIRVNVDTLEELMTMVSELVLTRNQLLEMVRRLQDSEFAGPLQRLSSVTAELQEGIMKTRMQPIGNAWQKLPRLVRDLSNDLNKPIELVMNGAETELDRQVLELIKDPLTHMVRNSADHGLEMPDERIAANKPETGTVTLSAYHQGGHIIIEIADDGKGLDVEKIKEKVIENGLATEAELAEMSDPQIQKFIFKAGFSTAKVVTSVSGRGVGMDVVRTNIELIGGSVDVQSKAGEGSVFYIKIPLTLAIVSALIVRCGDHRFAIPQLSVLELVRAQPGSDHRIEMINATPVLRLRNKLLPLVHLRELLEIKPAAPGAAGEAAADTVSQLLEAAGKPGEPDAGAGGEPASADGQSAEGEAESQGFIIVVQVANQTFGIVVDDVFDTEEIVVKPMSTMLRDVAMFSGNTILGDGSVIMIVDPNGVAQALQSQSGSMPDAGDAAEEAEAEILNLADRTESLLLFRAGSDTPKAVPLSLVTRLEEIDVANIETTNGRDLVQYRGALMPLVYVDEGMTRKETGEQPVLVFVDNDRAMGLVVDEIVDIVDEPLKVEVAADKPGLAGSAVVRGQATEILDVGYYLPLAFDDWFQRKEQGDAARTPRLLLVDDSAFFRNMLGPVLMAAGYQVTTVESASRALQLKENGAHYEIIVSDIEMPEMDGFAFAEALRGDAAWGRTPLIALSSLCTPEAIERGRACGFHDYVAKFDRQGLLETLKETTMPIGEAA